MADFSKSEGGIWMPDKGATEDIVNLAQVLADTLKEIVQTENERTENSKEQRDLKRQEIYNDPIYKDILNKVKNESKEARSKRALLKRQLNECLGDDNPDYCNEKYNDAIKKLDGYTDENGNVHDPEDRIHNHFLNKVTEQDKENVLRQSIKDQHKEITKDMSNKERKEYKRS